MDEDVLNAAKKLEVIGCFCIGTNQVDLNTAQKLGVRLYLSTPNIYVYFRSPSSTLLSATAEVLVR